MAQILKKRVSEITILIWIDELEIPLPHVKLDTYSKSQMRSRIALISTPLQKKA